jgi:hypothetical protein
MTTYRIRQLFATLAATETANPTLLEGEVWIEKDGGTGQATGRKKTGDGVTAFTSLPFDPGGSGSGLSAFVHNQASASFTWTINHNLGYRPSVELFDAGSQEFDAEVTHPTVNQTVVNLSVSTAGFARLL